MREVTRPDASETERQIKRLAATSRTAAYELIARIYLSGLARLVAKVVKDDEEARDLAAETIVRAMEEPRLLEPEFQIQAWLHRVAFNGALNSLRDKKRRETILALHGSALLSSTQPNPEECHAAAELAATLDRLLRRLTSEHEAIIRLRYHEGLDYKEIANRLDVPIGTVMSRLSRAHERLREQAHAEELQQSPAG